MFWRKWRRTGSFSGKSYGGFAFKDQLDIKFYDEFSEYYFIPKQFAVTG
jgi:thiamine pyrophosphokinase